MAWDPNGSEPAPPMNPFTAIWDTGATGSMITQAVVDACGLTPTGMTEVHHAHGSSLAEVFLVNIGLPNAVAFSGIPVTKGVLPGNSEVLIGMDIIATGDFAVTNLNGKTKFTFRVPSQADIDFVKEEQGGTGEAALRRLFTGPLAGTRPKSSKPSSKAQREKNRRR